MKSANNCFIPSHLMCHSPSFPILFYTWNKLEKSFACSWNQVLFTPGALIPCCCPRQLPLHQKLCLQWGLRVVVAVKGFATKTFNKYIRWANLGYPYYTETCTGLNDELYASYLCIVAEMTLCSQHPCCLIHGKTKNFSA